MKECKRQGDIIEYIKLADQLKAESDFDENSKGISLASVFQKFINNQNDQRDLMKLEN